MTLIDRVLKRFGLMRISQQPVRGISFDEDGHCQIEFRNGYRWAGRPEREYLQYLLVAPNPFFDDTR